MLRRVVLPVLAVFLVIGAAVPASAAPHRRARVRHISRVSVEAEGRGSVIAVTYASGPHLHIRFLHSAAAIDRVAVSDVDNDGQQDILAALHDGEVQLWRNRGYGHFSLATIPRDARFIAEHGPRFIRAKRADDGGQWGDERYDAVMPRAPAATAVELISDLASPAPVFVPLVTVGLSSGRAPPTLS
jgi:hypothetical protein